MNVQSKEMTKNKNNFLSLVTHNSLLATYSGILLTLCFPKFSFGFLAWVALVPFLRAVHGAKSLTQALLCGLITGSVFFASSLYWLNHVAVFGWIFVTCLETSFFLFLSWAIYEGRNIRNVLLRVFWVALAWTSAELMRSEFPIFGFGWNLLGYSQSNFHWILQSANTVGAYGLGFAIAFVNACFFEMTVRIKNRSSVYGLLSMALLVFALLLSHGYYHFNKKNVPDSNVRISLLQGNIPQLIKWEPQARIKIIELYSQLMELASFEEPDLIIWPEAAFPGYFNRDPEAERVLNLIRKIQVPVIMGSPHFQTWEIAFNSAYLLDKNAEIQDRYDKLFLVPFGEYVPLKLIFGWLAPFAYTLGVSDFSAGKEHTVFKLRNEIPFSILICFEDIFPNLAREFTNRGARFISVITNDAWFGDSSAPYQHLDASIFRAVENGVPMVRAANTGVSAFISKKGIVLGRVQDSNGKDTFVFGKETLTIPLEKGETLYRRGGYLFPYVAAVLFIFLFIIKRFSWSPKLILYFSLWSMVCGLGAGCIRVAGGTGVWYKGANDESLKEKSIGFDTQDIVQKDNKAPGSIEV